MFMSATELATALPLFFTATACAQAQLVAGQIYGGSVQFNKVCSEGGQGFYSEPFRVTVKSNGDAQYLFTNITSSGTDMNGNPIPQGGISVLTFKSARSLWSEESAVYSNTYNGLATDNGSWPQTFTNGSNGVVTATGTFNIFNAQGQIICTEPTNATYIPLPKGL